MANINWRTINVDALDPESSANFEIAALAPAVAPVSTAEVQQLGQQCRQLLRGGDAEGALRGALEGAPYGGDAQAKVSTATTNTRATEPCSSYRPQSGSAPRHGRRDSPVHQTDGDDAHAHANLPIRWS